VQFTIASQRDNAFEFDLNIARRELFLQVGKHFSTYTHKAYGAERRQPAPFFEYWKTVDGGVHRQFWFGRWSVEVSSAR
jgi:hypothetical protein